MGLAPSLERSRSGNGAHVWFFFSEPVSAANARRLGTSLLTRTMAHRHELSFSSYDRLFPSQDIVPKGGFGNLIALPFQGQAQKNGNSLFVDDSFVPYPDQWAFLSSLPKVTPEQLEECLKKLCRNGDMGELADTTEKQVPGQRKQTRQKLTRGDFPIQVTFAVWGNLFGFGMVCSKIETNGVISKETRYYITSLKEVGTFANAVRSHWGIENSLHWCLDMTFHEDYSRVRKDHSAENMAVVRHIALDVLKNYPAKISLARKRRRCTYDDDFLANVLLSVHASCVMRKPWAYSHGNQFW